MKKKIFRNFKKMKNYFARNFLRNLRMCQLLANGIVNGLFLSCVCLARFNKYRRTTEIVHCSSTGANHTKYYHAVALDLHVNWNQGCQPYLIFGYSIQFEQFVPLGYHFCISFGLFSLCITLKSYFNVVKKISGCSVLGIFVCIVQIQRVRRMS